MGDKKHSIKIVWGEADTIKELYGIDINTDKVPEDVGEVYTFNTEGELNAFMEGVNESMQWLNYWIVGAEGMAE